MTSKNLHIWGINELTHLRMRLICTVRNISMAKLLDLLIEREWKEDKTIANKVQTRKMKKIISKFTK